MEKGNIFKIAGENYELYNITDRMLHFAKLGKNGKKLSSKNASNLMNLTPAQFDKFAGLLVITAA